MSITTAKSNNMKSYLKVLVMFLITIIIALLPPFGAITPLGMKVLGVFVGVLYGWCVLDTLWVSIYAMVILGVLFNNVLGTFGSGLSNQITLMCLITAILGGALDSLKITDLLCNWCLTRDFLKGRPWALVSMILVAGALIGALASSIAGTFLLWVIILRLADICNYEKGCKEMAFLLGMVVIVPAVASNCIPFQPGAIFFCSFLTQGTGLTVGYGSFLIYQLTISALVFIAVVLLGKFVWKLDFSRFNISEEMREELLNQKVTYEQKVGLISVLAFFILLLAPGILPKTIPGMALLSKLGIVGVGGILLVILTVMRNSEGKSLINLNTCHHAVPWNVVWLMAAIAPLSDALKSADTGYYGNHYANDDAYFPKHKHDCALYRVCRYFVLINSGKCKYGFGCGIYSVFDLNLRSARRKSVYLIHDALCRHKYGIFNSGGLGLWGIDART